MTRIDKSDAQLDAEAEARRRRLDPPKPEHGMDDPAAYDAPEFKPSPPPKGRVDLTALRFFIIDIRRAFLAEVPNRIHQQHTSKSPDDELDAKGWAAYPDEGGVGLPFHSKMHRYLRTNSQVWGRAPSPTVRPAMASVYEASDRCHARHTGHQRPGYSRSLCAEMMYQVGMFGQEPEDLAWHFDLPLETVETLLLYALRHARSWREDITARLSRIAGTEDPLPERRPFKPAA